MTDPITLDELMAELDRLGKPKDSDDGHTAAELSVVWRKGLLTTRRLIGRCIEHGVMVSGRAYRTAIDGTSRTLPVYRFVDKPKRRR